MTSKVLRLQNMGGASPYLGAVRAEHAGPAARSLRFALLERPGLGALSSVRRANVRSRSGIQKFAPEGTKHGRKNHQTTIIDLGLVMPAAHGAPRAGFLPPLTLPCCGTYLQGGNEVDVHGDSAALYPAHCHNQRTRVTVLLMTALAETRASVACIAATLRCSERPSAARATILDETTWDAPSATRAAISSFTVNRHNAMLHHVAQLFSYHPATIAWQRHFLDILANQRHSTPSDASSAGVPYYSPMIPYQGPTPAYRPPDPDGNNHHPALVPTFLTSSYSSIAPRGRDDTPLAAAYHVALGAKHTTQTSKAGAAIAAGCTRVTNRCTQPADNGLSAGYSVPFEHAFLEDICYPAYRVFGTSFSCATHDALSRRSYAGRALLPCLERTAKECDDAFVNASPCLNKQVANDSDDALNSSFHRTKRIKRDHCLRLAIFVSVGVLHSPPVSSRSFSSKGRSYDRDSLLSDAADLGHDIGPLLASSLLFSWCLTHATAVPVSLSLPFEPPPRLFSFTVWGDNPGAGAFFMWLLPILLPELDHIRFVVSLTHCSKGGAGWRKYTCILTNDGALASRVGPCGSCPHTNCGHSKRHEVIIGGNTSLSSDALHMKHSIPPALYDTELSHLRIETPPDQRHHYVIVHMGSGSQPPSHISCHGFVVLTVDWESTTTTAFRTVSPTLRIDYDSRPSWR